MQAEAVFFKRPAEIKATEALAAKILDSAAERSRLVEKLKEDIKTARRSFEELTGSMPGLRDGLNQLTDLANQLEITGKQEIFRFIQDKLTRLGDIYSNWQAGHSQLDIGSVLEEKKEWAGSIDAYHQAEKPLGVALEDCREVIEQVPALKDFFVSLADLQTQWHLEDPAIGEYTADKLKEADRLIEAWYDTKTEERFAETRGASQPGDTTRQVEEWKSIRGQLDVKAEIEGLAGEVRTMRSELEALAADRWDDAETEKKFGNLASLIESKKLFSQEDDKAELEALNAAFKSKNFGVVKELALRKLWKKYETLPDEVAEEGF